MLPIGLLRSAIDTPVLVELKSGETYNGILASIDTWMNMTLSNVTYTVKGGNEFWSIPEIYIRGNSVKFFQIPESIIDVVKESHAKRARANTSSKSQFQSSSNHHYQNQSGSYAYSNRGRGRGAAGGGSRGGRGGGASRGGRSGNRSDPRSQTE
uniref:U6 snRNA-associated Sm-like protein LSm4 n=1 Tax=Timspurckia oligopyrenoides TaxID=708627 RepID=A0A7S0ZDY4_9RHOD|mmetsp:Transcript_1475/g.2657  ORF Transcript_1475/g.2657 Transcript_1475/m.2657 type:complete len:154 (+) Transcript_1475:85-546(+)